MALRRIQATLADLYDVDIGADVEDFLCDADEASSATNADVSRGEVLLVAETADDINVGLYIDPIYTDRLAEKPHGDAWLDGRFDAACIATEGVSHFMLVLFRAIAGDSVSELELELQAEIDKYASAMFGGYVESPEQNALAGNGARVVELLARSRTLREQLFERIEYIDAAGTEQGDRYRLASKLAHEYARMLERRFVEAASVVELRAELRRFYRVGFRGKLERIARGL